MAALRAVKPDEPAQPRPKAKTVAEAAKTNDELALLVAMRDRIALAVSDEKCPARDLASLTKRLQDISEKIRVLRDAEGDDDGNGDTTDEFDPSAI